MTTRILHVSDLHSGTKEDPAVRRALGALIEQVTPELVIVSGDLTHRNKPEQHQTVATFLRAFGADLLVVPGNHDIPAWPPWRFTSTFREFERVWGDTQPVHRSEGLHVVGLNSVRPWRHQSGGLRRTQLAWAAERLSEAAPGALRVVALHHHMIGAPWRTRKKPVAERNRVLASLVDSGAELILAGHTHQGAVSERREFEVVHGDVGAVVVSVAPGLGQPRPHRRGEARGLHVYEAAPQTVRVSTYIWRDEDWARTAERLFPRGLRPLATNAALPAR
ncbi:MAG: metallophosphoesterase [Gaiellaceae bacterium]